MGRRRTLGKKRRRRTNKTSSMMRRRRRTINKMRGGVESDCAERIKKQLYQYDIGKTHSRSQGGNAMMDALEENINLLNTPPYKATAFTSGAVIYNDGTKLNYDDDWGGSFSCTIDDFNNSLLQKTPKVIKYRKDTTSSHGLGKQFTETT